MRSGIERATGAGFSFSEQIDEGKSMAANNLTAADETFERVKTQLKARLGKDVYSSWFMSMKLAEVSKGVVRISVPTAFLRSWINGHYLDLVTDIWKQEQSDVLKVELVVRSATRNGRTVPDNDDIALAKAAKPSQAALGSSALTPTRAERPVPAWQAATAADPRQRLLGSPLDGRYTFQSFVEGPSNRVAFAAARAVAEQAPNAVRFNPLFLHASVGLGKTHILQAIAAEALKRDQHSRVVYLTAEYFMWRFATAIRDNNALTFKEQLRDIDLLIIDDMQFLQGKSIQNEFCHLINMLLDSAKQVVVAADRPPAELESLEPVSYTHLPSPRDCS